jgi:hypothetical protein
VPVYLSRIVIRRIDNAVNSHGHCLCCPYQQPINRLRPHFAKLAVAMRPWGREQHGCVLPRRVTCILWAQGTGFGHLALIEARDGFTSRRGKNVGMNSAKRHPSADCSRHLARYTRGHTRVVAVSGSSHFVHGSSYAIQRGGY